MFQGKASLQGATLFFKTLDNTIMTQQPGMPEETRGLLIEDLRKDFENLLTLGPNDYQPTNTSMINTQPQENSNSMPIDSKSCLSLIKDLYRMS